MARGKSARRFGILAVVFILVSTACASNTETLKVGDVTFELVRIPAGRFLMGSSSGSRDERPAYEVAIADGLYLGRTEVTVRQFRAFAEATGYKTDAEKLGWANTCPLPGLHPHQRGLDWRRPGFEPSDDHPAVVLSRNDAAAFCRWLSEQTGRTCRLPTEAEWEYAARAGRQDDSTRGLEDVAWHEDNTSDSPHTVATKVANPWGLHDMHGNAWEWCLDFFTTSYEGAPTDGSPRWDLSPASDVVSRGGSFRNPPGWLGSAIRMGSFPDCSNYNNGFRIVRVLKDTGKPTNKPQPSDNPQRQDAPAPAGLKPAALVPVEVELPTPVFQGTREDFRAPNTKPVQTKPGPPFLAPVGTRNVALGKPVSASDPEPIIGEIAMITDGDKEAADGSYVELAPLLQHVTIDLQGEYEIYGIRAWHYHKLPRVYFDVIVQISTDPDFITDVRTVFNNDMDNSAGLGVGTDMHYVDTSFGEIFDAKGLRGRYVRLYSRGNTSTDLNHYIEVEVYGRPADRG